jgi:hypothetical protein
MKIAILISRLGQREAELDPWDIPSFQRMPFSFPPGSLHEPFCTVWLQQMSESIGVSKRAVCPPNQTA